MELLVVMLVELAVVIMTIVTAVTVNVVVLVLDILFLVVKKCCSVLLGGGKKISGVGKSQGEYSTQSSKTPLRTKKSFVHKISVWGAVVCTTFLVLLMLTVFIANTFFLDSVVRFVLRKVHDQTNIEVQFDNAKGSFFNGQIRLEGITIKRQNHGISNIDIKGESIDLNLSLSDLLHWSVVFDTIKISKFTGTWEQVGKTDQELKPQKSFTINQLLLDDVDIDFSDRTLMPLKVNVKLDKLKSLQIRSDYVLLDTLFHSQGNGSVNKIPFIIDSEDGKCVFRINNFPTEVSVAQFGFNDWLIKGKSDIVIKTAIGDSEIAINLNLKLTCGVETLKEVPLPVKLLLSSINQKLKPIQQEFNVQMKESEFKFISTSKFYDDVLQIIDDKVAKDIVGKIKNVLPSKI
ncbi:MAG: hypothetical protein ACRC2T_13335 [Thermoguttaceae bacterium]